RPPPHSTLFPYTTLFRSFAERQVKALIETHPDFFPMYTVGGKWHHAGEKWTQWTDGFLGGMMWQFFLRSHKPFWREKAEHYSRLDRKSTRLNSSHVAISY